MAWESPLQSGSKSYSHKRCNARFKGAWRVHTPPCPRTAHTADHRAKQGRFGWGRYYYPRRALRSYKHPQPRCYQHVLCRFTHGGGAREERTRSPFGTETRAVRVSVPERRGPAGPRCFVAVSCTALTSFVTCHRCVEVQRRNIHRFHALCRADSFACIRRRSAVLSNAVNCCS